MPTGRIVKVPPELIRPPHSIRDCMRLQQLYSSMRKSWRGRPILGYVVRWGRAARIVALTGTHRHGAALLAQLPTIPVEPIRTERYPPEWRFAADGVYLDGQKIGSQEALYQAFRAYGMRREAELLRIDLQPARRSP